MYSKSVANSSLDSFFNDCFLQRMAGSFFALRNPTEQVLRPIIKCPPYTSLQSLMQLDAPSGRCKPPYYSCLHSVHERTSTPYLLTRSICHFLNAV